MKIARMFRICTPDGTAPSGTLCIMEPESGKTIVLAISDDGTRAEHRFDDVIVTLDGSKTLYGGRVVGRADVESEWQFYRELPMTGDRVTQIVASMRVNPAVTAKG